MQTRGRKTRLTALFALILFTASFALMAMPANAQAQQATNIQEGGSIPLPALSKNVLKLSNPS
jgi:hypothetical protein